MENNERGLNAGMDVRKASDDPVDAVFVIGEGSVHANEELRYALRNLEKHCSFIRDVYICGYCPSWVDTTKLRHLRWPDRFKHAKDANIIDKLRHACEVDGIAKKILFCSDDQFQTRQCSWEDFFPRYLRRYSSDDSWYESMNRAWHSRLRRTLEREVVRRKKAGLDPNDVFYYQPHIWMPIDRDVFLEYAKWCDYPKRDDTIIASGYFNFAGVKGEVDTDHMFLSGPYDGVNTTHVAYHDGSFSTAMSILKNMFPDRCRFEKVSAMQPAGMGKPDVDMLEDGSPASTKEMAKILSLMSKIRKEAVWHDLLCDMSLCEEMRLFGAKGWRVVWRDLIARWERDTFGGTRMVPVETAWSCSAEGVVSRYVSDPDAMRTVSFEDTMCRDPKSNTARGACATGAVDKDSVMGRVREALQVRRK